MFFPCCMGDAICNVAKRGSLAFVPAALLNGWGLRNRPEILFLLTKRLDAAGALYEADRTPPHEEVRVSPRLPAKCEHLGRPRIDRS